MTPAEITKQTSIRALKRMLIVERDSTRCAQMHKAWSLMAGAGWTGGYPNERRSEYLVRLMHPLLNERISLIVQWNKYSETVALILRPLALQVAQIYSKIRTMDRRTTMPELMDAVYRDSSINNQRFMFWADPEYEGLENLRIKVDKVSTRYRVEMQALMESVRTCADKVLAHRDAVENVALICDAQIFLSVAPYLLAWRAGWESQKYEGDTLRSQPGPVGPDPIGDMSLSFGTSSGKGTLGMGDWMPPAHKLVVKGQSLVDVERVAGSLLQSVAARGADGALHVRDFQTVLRMTSEAQGRRLVEVAAAKAAQEAEAEAAYASLA